MKARIDRLISPAFHVGRPFGHFCVVAGLEMPKRTTLMLSPRLSELIVGLGVDHVEIGDAAQRQRQRAALARAGERLGLLGLQFKRHGLADHGVLAVFFLRRLVDRQNADIGQDDFRVDDIGGAGAIRVLLALGKNDVDPVVGQDKAAGAGFRRDFGRDGAHAGRQDRGHEARPVGLDQLRLADRLAGDKRRARDRAGDLVGGIRAVAAANEIAAGGRGRPGLPLHVFGLDRLAKADVGLRHQNVHGLQLRDRFGGKRFVVGPTRKICGNAAGTDSDGQDDNACGIHTLHFPHYAATLPPP